DRCFAVGRGKLGRLAQPGQYAVAGGTITGELGEGRLGFLMLAGFGQRHGLLECSARLGCLLGLPPFIATPGADGGYDEDAKGDEIVAVTLPQLRQLLAADFFIDFLEYVAHEPVPNTQRSLVSTSCPACAFEAASGI